ncbi:hypothetical protein C8J57DRAFT_1095298, partial [Mycena rebaudengoi]
RNEIRSHWVSLMNDTLNRDKLLSIKLALVLSQSRSKLVLNTWSGTLLDEDSLLDDWIKSKGVLVVYDLLLEK